jgi:hypothetical protein
MAAPKIDEVLKAMRGELNALLNNLQVLEAVLRQPEEKPQEQAPPSEETSSWDRPATEAQLRYLERLGLSTRRELTRGEASAIITALQRERARAKR